jgi:hypothetical protein
MRFRLTIEHADGYLRFEVSGERVPGELTAEMLEVWSRVAEACRASGVDRVIGINRLTGPVPTLEAFQIGEQVPRVLGPSVRKLAFVVLGGEEAVRANQFFENVAVNRGLMGRVFDDEAAALDWLVAS